MLEIAYIYTVILGCLFVYKTLSNDPERDKIWGSGTNRAKLEQKEREIKLLQIQLDHYKTYHPDLKDESPREESMV